MYDKLKQTLNSISRIEDADWLMMEPFLKQKHFRKNEFFLQSGEIGKQLGFIVSGSFRWYFINKKGEEMNFHFFFENSFIVEYQSFISQEPSSMFIQAMEDSTIILLPPRDKIFEFYGKSHNWSEFGRKIAQYVYVGTADRVQDFLFHTAEERYINLMKRYPNILDRVSLSNISSYIGIKGPSLSRIKKRLSKK